jgi:hypothetical protein
MSWVSFRRLILLTATLLLAKACFTDVQAVPTIEITNLPPYGSFANVGGRVLNAVPAAYRVAVFIYVPGAGWYSKPFCNPQLTVIQPDSSWTADITTGGSDQFATMITALLVSTNYSEACVQGPATLPTNVTAQAIASATVVRYDPSIRRVNFSGYDWWLKAGAGPIGPGPNYFSDSTNNVWLDAQGQLHLRITNRSNQWQCVEAITSRTFGYGSYRFELNSSANDLDRNVVLGLFTWSDDPAYAHREIDVECSRWGNASDFNNAQYVVQPFDTPGHLVRFRVPANQTNSTHLWIWETNRIRFQSQRGSYVPNPAAPNVISNWNYTLAVPQSGDENVRINLWLVNGTPPTDNHEVEFIIKSFQFVPLGPAQPALLTNVSHLSGGQVQFTLLGQPDRRYTVQASTNLLVWQDLANLLATNSTMGFSETNPASNPRFYRVVTEQ